MIDTIKAALRAACETDGLFGIKPEADRDIMRDRAAAVAAFLRAPDVWDAIMEDYEAVTEAVDRAARED